MPALLIVLAFVLGALSHRACLLVVLRRWERAATTDDLRRERKWVAILFRHHVLNCRRWD